MTATIPTPWATGLIAGWNGEPVPTGPFGTGLVTGWLGDTTGDPMNDAREAEPHG